MTVEARPYDHEKDFNKVKAFLIETFFQKDSYQSWIPTRFENSVFNDEDRSENVRVWLESSRTVKNNTPFLVGLVVLNHPNDFILVSNPKYKFIVEEMVSWVELQQENLDETTLATYSISEDAIQNAILTKLGYTPIKIIEHTRIRSLETPTLDYPLPEGFQIKPIGENDYDQYVKAIELVFQHPHFTHKVYEAMRKTHFYHADLNLGAFTQDGTLVAFCMLRIDEYKIGEFEPVGTLPEYRRQGLARSLMTECIIRAKTYDINLLYIGGAPTEEADRLYESLGFIDKTDIYRWEKKLG